jgi:ABC-type molybdate transport system permease subunit
MLLTESDLQAIGLTVRLAGIVTLTLLVVGTPIAWRLARTRHWSKGPLGAVASRFLALVRGSGDIGSAVALHTSKLMGQHSCTQ